jgi:uncharacterized protein YacL
MVNSKDKQWVLTVVAISAVCFIAALITAVIITGHLNAASTPVISAFLGLVGILVPAIAATLKSAQTRELTREIDRKVNGHLSRLTEAAINAGVKPEDLPPLPPDVEKPAES